MKTITRFVCGVALLTALSAPVWAADTYVQGYYRSNGTYVEPHYRSAPDGNPYNNWSTQGNVNPYTGQMGTHNPDALTTSPYGSSYSNPYRYNPYGR